MYYINNNREMGDYLNDEPIGKHVTLTANWDEVINNLDYPFYFFKVFIF